MGFGFLSVSFPSVKFQHGPTFIFPLNQQQAAVRPRSVKSPPAAGSVASSSASSSASMSSTASAIAGPTPMSFNYPNLPGNETQYLAIMQNGAFPIPIPAHVGAATAYRGTHPQAMPLFNGSFYSSQMLHPSQLQQQQPSTQTQQSQQGHQNPSITSGSSSSQKHLQNQQQRLHGSGVGGDGENLQGFPGPKNQLPHSLPNQQRQQMQNQNVSHQARQLESELGEDSPSTADSQVFRPNMSLYGQNLMPIHPANFALMNPTPMGGARSASGNTSEKKPQQPQTQISKAGAEPSTSQAFAMSFTSINGTTASQGLDISSIAHNHALLQSLPEAARHGYHLIAPAQAAQQKKNYRVSEEGKTGGNDTSNVEEERKAIAGLKAPLTAGQSIVFSRADLTDSPISTMPVNNVIDSSARTLNLGTTPARTSGSVMSATISGANAPSIQQQMQRNQQQQQQQILQLQKQQQQQFVAAASSRSKTPAASNGSAYPDHISSSSAMATKFPNALSAFPQNFVQNSSSPAQSPQWKNSVRTTTSQVPSPSLTPASSTLKNLPQQQGRTQGGHTQISFAANQKPSASPQGQPNPSSNQSPSPPMMVGSPTTSISKSAGGSPRTSASTSNKGGQSSTLSSQQSNSASVPVQKSSPVGGRNVPSILGHPHNTSSSNSGTKPQMSHQQPLSKHAFPQAQMYTNAYMQAQAQHAVSSTNTTPAGGGFYLQRHRSDQQQQSQGTSATSSTGMLSLCPPVTLAFTSSTDPAKTAASNMKGGGLPSQGLIHAQFAAAHPAGKQHQILPAGFPYVHHVPTVVQVKPAEKKQPAGE
jgi:hypothetical protein